MYIVSCVLKDIRWLKLSLKAFQHDYMWCQAETLQITVAFPGRHEHMFEA